KTSTRAVREEVTAATRRRGDGAIKKPQVAQSPSRLFTPSPRRVGLVGWVCSADSAGLLSGAVAAGRDYGARAEPFRAPIRGRHRTGQALRSAGIAIRCLFAA